MVAPFQLPVITGVFCAIMQISSALAFSGLSVCVNVLSSSRQNALTLQKSLALELAFKDKY